MGSDKKISAGLQTLRELCNDAISREERLGRLNSLSQHDFLTPEHQVVFESVCVLLRRGSISASQLRVHLNNRGFPDVDVETYFPRAQTRSRGQENSNEAGC